MLSIIIPNYNNEILLKNCINSISQDFENSNFEVIIVDNGSKEFTPTYYEGKIRYTILERNVGFSKAVNIGIKQAKGDYIAILNNDTEIDSHWIENIISTFETNPDVMFITSKIKSLKRKELIDDVGDVILSSGKVYKIGNGEKEIGQYNMQKNIFGASGCASVYRREFFEKVGYFDEDFFAYLEDVDLSFRANLLGYKCLYVPDAVVYHVGSATTGSQYNKFTVFHLAQNTINVIVKNFPTKILIKSLPSIVAYIMALQIFLLQKSEGASFFKGLLSGIGMIGKMRVKRREIMGNRVLSDNELNQIFKVNKSLYRSSKRRRNS